MKKILFFVLIISESFSQKNNSQYNLKDLLAMPNDTLKVQKLREAATATEQTDKKLAREYYRQAIQVSKNIKSEHEEAITSIHLAGFFNNTNKFDSAAIWGNTALTISQKNKDQLAVGRAYNVIGMSWHRRSNYPEAIKNLLAAAKIFEKLHENKRTALLYANIAAVYAEINDSKKGAEYGEKAITMAVKSKDPEALAKSYFNTGAAYGVEDDHKYIAYYKKGLPHALQTNNPALIQQGYYNITNGYYQIGLVEKRMPALAAAYADTSYQWAEKTGNPLNLFFASNISAQIAINNQQYAKADEYLKTTAESLKEVGSHFRNRIYYSTMALLRNAQGRYKEAYEYRLKQDIYKDSLINEERIEEITDLQTKYETDKKDSQIKLQATELKQKTTNNILLIGGISALALLSLLGFRNYRNKLKIKQQENTQLRQQQQLTATESIIKGQEEERSRLARDLHDGLGGLLSGIKLTLNNMTGNVILSEQNAQIFDRALGQLDNAISEMRRVAHSMMPESLIKFGLTDAVNDFCEGISQSGKLKVRFQALGMAGTKLPQTTEVTLYRIVQELLNNTLKHAKATEALVQLSKNDNLLTLSVEDNGQGFESNNILTSKGIGMKNIENRVAFLNGTMDIRSALGSGTSIQIDINM
jgi:two-component system, NarL family, sensor kinase